jgi:hypothetical protein
MNADFYLVSKKITVFIRKHHAVIFITPLCIFLSIAIYFLYLVIQTTLTPSIAPASTIGSFDQKTIDKIKNLHDSTNSPTTVALPSPRPNPFVE